MALSPDQTRLALNPDTEKSLSKLLQELGSSRTVIAETARLRLCTPTLLDILLHVFECSQISELINCLQTEYEGNETTIRSKIERILKARRDPEKTAMAFLYTNEPIWSSILFSKGR